MTIQHRIKYILNWWNRRYTIVTSALGWNEKVIQYENLKKSYDKAYEKFLVLHRDNPKAEETLLLQGKVQTLYQLLNK